VENLTLANPLNWNTLLQAHAFAWIPSLMHVFMTGIPIFLK
jgi:hypothetical protein